MSNHQTTGLSQTEAGCRTDKTAKRKTSGIAFSKSCQIAQQNYKKPKASAQDATYEETLDQILVYTL